MLKYFYLAVFVFTLACSDSSTGPNDNTDSGLVACDFNSDGIVDFIDFSMFSKSYGAEDGELEWDAAYDLNNDGIIDQSDFLIFHSHLGKTVAKVPNT